MKKNIFITAILWGISQILSFGQGNFYHLLEELDTYESLQTDSLLQLANRYLYKEAQSSKNYALEVLAIPNIQRLPRQKGFANFYLGLNHMSLGEWTKGQMAFEEAIIDFRNFGDSIFVGMVHDKLGYAFRQQGLQSEALKAHLYGLKLRENYGDSQLNIAYSYASVGGIYVANGKDSVALKYFNNALKIRQEEQDSFGMGHSFRSLGGLAKRQQQTEKATEFYQKALELYLAVEMHQFVISTRRYLAEIFSKKGEFETAFYHINEALKLAQQTESTSKIGRCYFSLGEIYDRQKQSNKAIESWQKAIPFFENTNSQNDLRDLYLMLAKAYEKNENLNKSINFYKKYLAQNDSLQLQNDQQLMAELRTKFELNQMEQENEKLKKEKQQFTRERFIYGSVFLLLLFAGIFIALSYRARKKAYQELLIEKKMAESILKEKEQLLKNLKNTQQQLIHADKMASLGQLTAGIAHEINNPINFIASNILALKLDISDINKVLDKLVNLKESEANDPKINELIRMGKQLEINYLKQEIVQLTSSIERGVNRTKNIVSGLSTFSRRSTEVFEKADLKEGLESTLIILKSKIGQDILIHKNYENLPPVYCQISRLNQVFLNIISNAVDAMDGKGELFIELNKINNPQRGEHATIKIKDTGKGMDEATKNKIFEPFFTTKSVGKGTGLGLSISYGIIQEHGGEIEVNTEIDKGTEFILKIPINIKQ